MVLAFQIFKNFDKKSKVILLRHDIDLSLEKALKMAEIESQLNLISTYFLRVNLLYNIFETRNNEIIKRILSLDMKLTYSILYCIKT